MARVSAHTSSSAFSFSSVRPLPRHQSSALSLSISMVSISVLSLSSPPPSLLTSAFHSQHFPSSNKFFSASPAVPKLRLHYPLFRNYAVTCGAASWNARGGGFISEICGSQFSDALLQSQRPVLIERRRRKSDRSQRARKVVAYYGLKTPPYSLDALEPYMSQKTLETHWGKHHHNYVEGLNKQLEKCDILYGYTLDELVKVTYNNGNPFPEFDNAAQVWNHDFFWESMQPGGGNMPKLGVLKQIEKDYGSFMNFKDKFVDSALSLFGSGWVWLVLKREEKELRIVKTSNAICPIAWDDIPIICLDMWEHSYYLDYKTDRAKYVNVFMDHLVSWNAAMGRMARAECFVNLGEPKIPIA